MPHLVIQELAVPAAGEWMFQLPGWSFLHVTQGAGYWMHPRSALDLSEGSVVVLSQQARGYFRASQLGGVLLRFFRVDPARLIGLTNVAEQHFFQRAAAQEQLSLHLLPPGGPLAERFKTLCAEGRAGSFGGRVQLLQLFIESFGDAFRPKQAEPKPERDARQRLAELLRQIPVAELADLEFAALAGRLHCTPRHLSRIFRDLVGMSFRQKQTEVRLTRAHQLLASTRFKVMDVALESGYQSLSLFNLLFKRRFGMSPSAWRSSSAKETRGGKRFRPVRPTAPVNC